jgi:hypothetical protein
MILKAFLLKNWSFFLKLLLFLQTFYHNITESWQKSQKIVIITSTPDRKTTKRRDFFGNLRRSSGSSSGGKPRDSNIFSVRTYVRLKYGLLSMPDNLSLLKGFRRRTFAQHGANPTTSIYNATSSVARFRKQKYFYSILKNALAFYNAGVVAVN